MAGFENPIDLTPTASSAINIGKAVALVVIAIGMVVPGTIAAIYSIRSHDNTVVIQEKQVENSKKIDDAASKVIASEKKAEEKDKK